MSTQALKQSANDLWACAAAKLTDVDRGNINFNRPDKLGILSEVLQLTEQSKQECIKKKWRYTRKNGEKVIFADLFAKVVKWVNLFREVGDQVVQYDPVHAALPWAGVRFLLQIAVNDHNKFAFAVESATSIAELICYYAILEDVCLRSPSAANDELRKALVRVYAATMIYLSRVRAYFNQNSAIRVVKSGLLSESDIETCFSAIQTAQEAAERYASLAHIQDQIDKHEQMSQLVGQILSPVKRLREDLASIKDDLDTTKRNQILSWISAEPYIQHHEQVRDGVLPGTGRWLLSDKVYVQWKKDSVSSILWLHGNPGSGKSMLVSIVVEEAMEAFHKGLSPPPTFFYCSRNTGGSPGTSPQTVIASIARQLSSLQSGFPILDPMVAIYKNREAEGFTRGPLQIRECITLITQLIEQYSMTTIVIDALDECDPENRADLLEALETILQESSCLVKIFVSSRNDQDLVCHLRDYPNLGISSSRNSHDIAAYVTKMTHHLVQKRKLLRFSSKNEELKARIVCEVTDKAQGMFLWVRFQLESLCECKSKEAIIERLGKLPRTLEGRYMEIYEKINRIPSNLYIYQSENLEKQPLYPKTATNALVAEICLYRLICTAPNPASKSFLSQHGLSSESGLPISNEFAKYANDNWAIHCHFAAGKRTEGMLKELFQFFISAESDPNSAIVTWFHNTMDEDMRFYELRQISLADLHARGQTILLLLSCMFDFPECLETPLSPNSFQDYLPYKGGRTAFQIAVERSSCGVVSKLSPSQYMEITEQVLVAATRSARTEMFTLLLSLGGEEVKITEEVVKAAARSDVAVMTLLLDRRGEEVKITEEVVEAAAANLFDGHEVMALLLDRRGEEVKITEEVDRVVALLHDRRRQVTISTEVYNDLRTCVHARRFLSVVWMEI